MVIGNHYQIQQKLGEGGMGAVYQGIDTRSGETVAIKQLKPDLTDAETLERFKREGEALRELNHPNIVKMLDAFEADGNHYLVMEYVSGGDLRQMLNAQGKLDLKQCLNIAIDLADALTRAHRLDIIHRDLKPENVLITTEGKVRLTDFGIAHVGSKERVTDAEVMMGTFDYLSPEAINGEAIDTRTDIWAFGIILCEMLTGENPFRREQIIETVKAIVLDPLPDLELLLPDVSTGLIDLIYRMLEKDRHIRISSVRHVGAMLEDILYGRNYTPQAKRFETPVPDIPIRPKHNLPAQLTEFIGREFELDELTKLFEVSSSRLITILAPGGMGKTRLAIEVARHQLELLEDGVYLVELAPLREANAIIPAIAEAMNYQFAGSSNDKKSELFNFLTNKSMLIVMDNYEHLTDGMGLVTELLNVAPELRILVTSRKRLEQNGEILFHLSGMEFPDWDTPEDALEYASVKLFVQSAKRAKPTFDLTRDNLDHVSRICRYVGGMPLGIVLSAAWLGLLSIEEIVSELQDNIDFLEADGGELPDRQHSIRVVFDYSWQMMNEVEQRTLMQLSIFRGSFTREAVQQIVGTNLRIMMSLANKSLLQRDATTGRYSMHELLRQYAREKLVSDDDLYQQIETTHATYYLNFAGEREDWLKGSKQRQAIEEIGFEYENIKRAWQVASENHLLDLLETAWQAMNLYTSRVRIGGMELLTNISLKHNPIDNLENTHSVMLRLKAIVSQDDNELLRIASIAEQRDDLKLQLHVIRLLPSLKINNDNDTTSAVYYAEKALELAQALGDDYALSMALASAGYFAGAKGDMQRYDELALQAYEIARKIGDYNNMSHLLGNLSASQSMIYGDLSKAIELAEESVANARMLGVSRILAFRLGTLAGTLIWAGQFERIEALGRETLKIALDVNDQSSIAFGYHILGFSAYIQRDFASMSNYLDNINGAIEVLWVRTNHFTICTLLEVVNQDEVAIRENINDYLNIVMQSMPINSVLPFSLIVPAIAYLLSRHGENAQAVQTLSVAHHYADNYKNVITALPVYQDMIQQLEETLSKEEFNTAWEQGKSMDFDAVVQLFQSIK